MTRVVLIASAQLDLKKIAEYTQINWGGSQKKQTLDHIKESIRFLGMFPESGTKTDKPDVFVKTISKITICHCIYF